MCHWGETYNTSNICKKAHREQITSLIKTINKVEAAHEQSTSQNTLQDLLYARSSLVDESGKCTRRRYILGQKVFYEHGNKSGRLLARTIQAAKTTSTIHQIRDKHGTLLSKNEDITKYFENFYSKLYNLPRPSTESPDMTDRTSQIKDFLTEHCPKPITT